MDGPEACARRDTLLAEWKAALRTSGKRDVGAAQGLLAALKRTYRGGRGPLRPALAVAHRAVAHALQRQSRPELYAGAIKHDLDGLAAAGVHVTDASLRGPIMVKGKRDLPIAAARAPLKGYALAQTCIVIAAAFVGMHETTRARRWLRAAPQHIVQRSWLKLLRKTVSEV